MDRLRGNRKRGYLRHIHDSAKGIRLQSVSLGPTVAFLDVFVPDDPRKPAPDNPVRRIELELIGNVRPRFDYAAAAPISSRPRSAGIPTRPAARKGRRVRRPARSPAAILWIPSRVPHRSPRAAGWACR